MSLKKVVAIVTGVVVAAATGLLVWSTSNAMGAEAPTAGDVLLSPRRPVAASSASGCCLAGNAVDGDSATRWASAPGVDAAWYLVDLGAVAVVHHVRLVWDDSCASGYELQTSTDRATWTTVHATSTGRGGTETVDANGTGRYLRINLTHRCGADPRQGYALREVNVYGSTDTRAPTMPGAVHVVGVAQPTSVTLGWTPSADNVGVLAYEVYAGSDLVTTVAGGTNRVTLDRLTPGRAYQFWVQARDGAGNVSGGSGALAVRMPDGGDAVPPGRPSGVTVVAATSGTVSLSWAPATDNAGVTGYCVVNAGTDFACDTPTRVRVEGLAANTAYQFAVVALDASGNRSPPSSPVAVTTLAAAAPEVPTTITALSGGWTVPWGLTFLPDRSLLVGERDSGRVFHVDADGGGRTLVGTVPDVVPTGGDGGLLGLAASPDFSTDHLVFVYSTSAADNRIARMTFDGTALGGYTPLVTGISRSRLHNGGRLRFGPDGYLYATTGDAESGGPAQDRNSLDGKVLRMRPDGTPAPGNPFSSLVYSYGHRDIQGIAWDSAGRLWEVELGGARFDELNLVRPGLNYGWPVCDGMCNDAGMTNPKATWPVNDAAPSGLAIVGDMAYLAGLRGERLWRVPLDGELAGTPQSFHVNQFGRLRTVVAVQGADALLVSTANCDPAGGAPPGSDKLFQVNLS